MTAPDHATKPLENTLRERGHPYMDGRHKAGHDVVGLPSKFPHSPSAACDSFTEAPPSITFFANPGAAIAIFSAKKRASAA
jgi:hypothetical protein